MKDRFEQIIENECEERKECAPLAICFFIVSLSISFVSRIINTV